MTPEAACIVMFFFVFVAAFAVALRLFAQAQQQRKCAADEYLILLALVSRKDSQPAPSLANPCAPSSVLSVL